MQSQALISHVALHCGQEKASHDEKNNRHECTKYHISDSSDTKTFAQLKKKPVAWVATYFGSQRLKRSTENGSPLCFGGYERRDGLM